MKSELIGYIFSIAALVLSAVGSVLTKKLTAYFEKNVIALYLGMAIGVVGWLQVGFPSCVIGGRNQSGPLNHELTMLATRPVL